MQILLQIATYGIIFGMLATAPFVTWLAVSWLITDRRRTSSRSDAR